MVLGAPQTPLCIQCGSPTTRSITRTSNRNGNAGRPYYKCQPCSKFRCFGDTRGLDCGNPTCDCGVPSRRQVSGVTKGRHVHYVCFSGDCDFYNNDGSILSEDLVLLLADLEIT